MNIILENILKKMCKFAKLNYDDFKWDDDKHINTMYKEPDSQEKFIDWLTNYLYKLKVTQLRQITDYPYMVHRNKSQCKKLAIHFEFMYGFKTYHESITKIRKKKINKIINNDK